MLPPPDKSSAISGFTLIEMSIVLIIIGLIVGGILTGQDLINAAAIRAQVAQIEKYNTAARTFQGKYGYLPGDIPNPYAANFGFQTRGTQPGQGDGNGLLQGATTIACGNCQQEGETAVFWVDLSTAGLIDANLSTASPSSASATIVAPQYYYPAAKIGNGNYVYAYNGGYCCVSSLWASDGINYFGVSAVTTANPGNGLMNSNLSMTVLQAYNTDKKVDDGLPELGSVRTVYLNGASNGSGPDWAGGVGGTNPTNPNLNYWADPYSATSCFDNGGNASNPEKYEIAKNASSQNCALSFRFQ